MRNLMGIAGIPIPEASPRSSANEVGGHFHEERLK